LKEVEHRVEPPSLGGCTRRSTPGFLFCGSD